MRVVGLIITGLIAVWFFVAAVYNVANHYLSFQPDKVSAEFGATMFFAGFGLLLSAVGAFCFVQIWKDKQGHIRHRAV